MEDHNESESVGEDSESDNEDGSSEDGNSWDAGDDVLGEAGISNDNMSILIEKERWGR